MPIRRRDDGYFAVMVVGLPSSPTKTTRTLAGTLPLLNSWVRVIESLDVCLAGFVLMRLSAVTLQFHLALEDIDVGRHRMFGSGVRPPGSMIPMTEMISGLSVFG